MCLAKIQLFSFFLEKGLVDEKTFKIWIGIGFSIGIVIGIGIGLAGTLCQQKVFNFIHTISMLIRWSSLHCNTTTIEWNFDFHNSLRRIVEKEARSGTRGTEKTKLFVLVGRILLCFCVLWEGVGGGLLLLRNTFYNKSKTKKSSLATTRWSYDQWNVSECVYCEKKKRVMTSVISIMETKFEKITVHVIDVWSKCSFMFQVFAHLGRSVSCGCLFFYFWESTQRLVEQPFRMSLFSALLPY